VIISIGVQEFTQKISDITFYLESRALVPNFNNKVYFESLDSEGNPLEFSSLLYRAKTNKENKLKD